MAEKSKEAQLLEAFRTLGCDIEAVGGNGKGTCLFCGKEGHFFVNVKTGQWDCKVCCRSGNLVSLMSELARLVPKQTSKDHLEKLARLRSCSKNVNDGEMVSPPMPISVFTAWGMGCVSGEWWLPCWSVAATVRDIRRWTQRSGRFMSVPTCEAQLGGALKLHKAPPGSKVWICEGEWDAMFLRWLLDEAGCATDIVVFVPGAGVFKKEWPNWFHGHDVIIAYDNDEAGDRGSSKAGRLLAPMARSVRYLCWPDTYPDGWDIRDAILSGRGKSITAEEALADLEAITRSQHRRHETAEDATGETGIPGLPGEKPATYAEVIAVFKKWASVSPDYDLSLKLVLATCLGNMVPGDPIWLYLVSPPGGGKTMILSAMRTSTRTLFRSTLTPASMISGFNVQPDPSLLPQLNGKTAIFKDGTELLAMHPDARREIYGVLRGAFDGYVHKSFGNGISRAYDVHFNAIIGITQAVHGDSQATMGERFLKFEMRDTPEGKKAKIIAAIGNTSKSAAMEDELAAVCRKFLLTEVDPTALPQVQGPQIERIMAMAELVSVLRAQVDREAFGDRDVRYRPSPEVGTRIAKQLTKLGQMLTFVFGVEEITQEIMDILLRVAKDTSVGFNVDIVRAMLAGKREPMARQDIARYAKIPEASLYRRLQDLEYLGIVMRTNTPPPPGHRAVRVVTAVLYAIKPWFAAIWDASQVPPPPAPIAAGNGQRAPEAKKTPPRNEVRPILQRPPANGSAKLKEVQNASRTIRL